MPTEFFISARQRKRACRRFQIGLFSRREDAQSIYSWRGANVDHIFDFTRTYPNARVYKIETNYRSVPAILNISNAAIAQNTRQFHKYKGLFQG